MFRVNAYRQGRIGALATTGRGTNVGDTFRMKAVLVLVAALAFAMSPFWAGGFGGFDPDRFPVQQINPPVTPAGYAFSIWGLIYSWLILSAGYGLLRRAEDAGWDRVRWPLLVSLAVGASWIPVAQQSPLGALVLIWVMLVAALAAMFAAPRSDRWWLAVPLSIYAGWLSAASFVSVALNAAGFGIGPGSLGWAWIAVAALVPFAAWVQMRRPWMAGYGLTLAWALAAVAVRNAGSETALAAVAGICAAGFAALPLLLARRQG